MVAQIVVGEDSLPGADFFRCRAAGPITAVSNARGVEDVERCQCRSSVGASRLSAVGDEGIVQRADDARSAGSLVGVKQLVLRSRQRVFATPEVRPRDVEEGALARHDTVRIGVVLAARLIVGTGCQQCCACGDGGGVGAVQREGMDCLGGRAGTRLGLGVVVVIALGAGEVEHGHERRYHSECQRLRVSAAAMCSTASAATVAAGGGGGHGHVRGGAGGAIAAAVVRVSLGRLPVGSE